MNETLLGATLAGNMMLMFMLWLSNRETKNEILLFKEKIDNSMANIEVELPDIDELREEILSVMGSMNTPSIVDHLGGVFAQIAHAKLARNMQAIPEELQQFDNDV